MSDNVYHPNHYTLNSIKLEPIELTGRLPSCVGQAVNYVLRARFKGTYKEDIEKAINYLNIQLGMEDMFSGGDFLFHHTAEDNRHYATMVVLWRDFYVAPEANDCGEPFESSFMRTLITANYDITKQSILRAITLLEDVRDGLTELVNE